MSLNKRLKTMAEGMRKGTTTDDYRLSMGEPETDDMFTLAYQWQDKPHRHVYDLCNEIDNLNAELDELRKQLAKLTI
jgi:hypothetical protein